MAASIGAEAAELAADKAEQRIIAGTPERCSHPLKDSSNQRLGVSLGGCLRKGADESPKINLPGCSNNLPGPFAMHMLGLFARPALTQPGLTQSKVLMPTSYPSAGVKRCNF
jgi:hypothetical protein